MYSCLVGPGDGLNLVRIMLRAFVNNCVGTACFALYVQLWVPRCCLCPSPQRQEAVVSVKKCVLCWVLVAWAHISGRQTPGLIRGSPLTFVISKVEEPRVEPGV
jgi:hypothetical protein